MKLQEVLTEYQYNNVGQFRAIAESLGYKEAYNKGSLLFTRNDEVFRIDMKLSILNEYILTDIIILIFC